MVLQTPMFQDYNWTIRSLKELQRISRALYKRPPAQCTTCGAEVQYNPARGVYVMSDGLKGACRHKLDNGRRPNRFADSTPAYAFKG